MQNGKFDKGILAKHRSRKSEIIAKDASRSRLRHTIASLGAA